MGRTMEFQMTLTSFGEVLRVLRQRAGLRTRDVAERARISSGTVSNWENNKAFPHFVQFRSVAEVYAAELDMEMSELERIYTEAKGRYLEGGRPFDPASPALPIAS